MALKFQYRPGGSAYCPECREPISKEASICPHCRSSLKDNQQWLEEQKKGDDNSLGIALAVLGLIFFIIVIFALS